ncbi:ganglioside gm2 activator [Plakobranchus ocellatus]|uniref:Ganglioside gm2 activator n=1 Tax=Plakobranchus ocellatus TaxID=259542 RepID=A0AAV4DXT8_9GAST|nr:ganglioside gm2 activator [Plakobranchus ocellatus]
MVSNLVICATVFTFSAVTFASAQEFQYLRDVFRASIQHAENKESRVNKFVYNNCGHPETDIFNLTSIIIRPDPVQLPGKVTLGASFVFRETARSPIKLQVEIDVRSGGKWLKLPCIEQVGTCTYEDICDLLSLLPACPEPLVSAGIPCQCPFPKGSYNLPASTIDIPLELVPPGDYKVKAVFTNGEKPGACIELTISFN